MKIFAIVSTTAFLALTNSHAFGKCVFAARPAVMCVDPKAAAYAFQRIGHNIAAANDSNNRQLLKEAQCTQVAGANFSTIPVLEYSRGRIATSNGWVPMAYVLVDGRYSLYVATDYLRGPCEKYSDELAKRDHGPQRPEDPTRLNYSMPTAEEP